MAKKMIKSSKKTTARLRKFEDGGMAGKGPFQPTPKKEKTAEELASETISRITTIPGAPKSEAPATKVAAPAPKAKLLPGGFKDQAQKDAYIKNTKNLLKTKSVADLVKMKHGTAAGLAALGFKDEVKKAAPVAKAPANKRDNSKNLLDKKTVTLKGVDLPEKNVISGIARRLRKDVAAGAGRGRKDVPSNFKMNTPAPLKNKVNTKDPVAKAPAKKATKLAGQIQKEKGKFKKEDGQALKAEGLRQKGIGLRQKGIGMAIKGKGLRNKAIASTDYRSLQAKVAHDADPMTKVFMPLSLKIKGKSQVKYVKYRPNNSELNQVEIDAMKKAKMTKNKPTTKTNKKNTPTKKQAERTEKFLATGTYPMFKRGGEITNKKK